MTQKYSSFSYKAGNTFMHKLPAWIKILLVPALSLVFFKLPVFCSFALILFQFVLATCLKFTLKEQFSDLKFVLYFTFILYFMSFVGIFCSAIFSETASAQSGIISPAENGIDFFLLLKSSFFKCLQNSATALMLVKLFCVIQTSSIVFKTTTSLEMREGVGKIESAIRKILHLKEKNTLTDFISFAIYFIPTVFKIWNQLATAWKARQGKTSVRMFLTLFPVLFSVGMKNAYNTAKAVMIRS